ncbi:RNA polymerase sigma factor [Stieleria bergensis]|uniref:RNA polymerase sigma factor n=1 Tax=Stieleria bergensis TaxID=2528025 RepID=A0A517SVH9_9BACT|nr:RNA polymerase sigma factor [Planctomycetes bacterium SV_7m_r]
MADTPNHDRQDDYATFVSLLARYDQQIRRFIAMLMHSSDAVDDVMQETAIECWNKFETFTGQGDPDEPEEFVRWANVIARYKVLSWQRDRARDRLVFQEELVHLLADTVHDEWDRLESERQAVQACLQKLPPRQRQLVLSVHSPGQSVADVARQTGQKPRRLYTVLNGLRKQLLLCVQDRITVQASQ